MAGVANITTDEDVVREGGHDWSDGLPWLPRIAPARELRHILAFDGAERITNHWSSVAGGCNHPVNSYGQARITPGSSNPVARRVILLVATDLG
jgi:hypothetical protein